MKSVQNFKKILAVSAILAWVFCNQSGSARASGNQLTQGQGGVIQYNSNSSNYQLKSEVGNPASGNSTSTNYIVNHGMYWETAQNTTGTQENPVSAGGGSVPTNPEPNPIIPSEPEKNNGSPSNTNKENPPASPLGPPVPGFPAQNGIAPTPVEANKWPEASSNVKPSSGNLISQLVTKKDLLKNTVKSMANILNSVLLPVVVVGQYSIFAGFAGGLGEGWLSALRLWQAFAGWFGLRRKPKYWGTVYDSKTKQPLDPVIMHLVDAETGASAGQMITDMAGRYGFMAKPGRYKILAKKTNYAFPSTRITGQNDEIFDHLYHGEIITVQDESDVVAPNIPMDALAYDWNQEDKQKYIKLHPLWDLAVNAAFNTVFWAGFSFTAFTACFAPATVYWIFLSIYLLILVLRQMARRDRLWGRAYDSKTHLIISGLVFELSFPNMPFVVSKARSSSEGKFFLKATPGVYKLTVKDEKTKTVVSVSDVVIGKKGMLTANLAI